MEHGVVADVHQHVGGGQGAAGVVVLGVEDVHQVAGLHLVHGDETTAVVVLAGRAAGDGHAQLVEHVVEQAGAVEAIGAGCAVHVGLAQLLLGQGHSLLPDGGGGAVAAVVVAAILDGDVLSADVAHAVLVGDLVPAVAAAQDGHRVALVQQAQTGVAGASTGAHVQGIGGDGADGLGVAAAGVGAAGIAGVAVVPGDVLSAHKGAAAAVGDLVPAIAAVGQNGHGVTVVQVAHTGVAGASAGAHVQTSGVDGAGANGVGTAGVGAAGAAGHLHPLSGHVAGVAGAGDLIPAVAAVLLDDQSGALVHQTLAGVASAGARADMEGVGGDGALTHHSLAAGEGHIQPVGGHVAHLIAVRDLVPAVQLLQEGDDAVVGGQGENAGVGVGLAAQAQGICRHGTGANGSHGNAGGHDQCKAGDGGDLDQSLLTVHGFQPPVGLVIFQTGHASARWSPCRWQRTDRGDRTSSPHGPGSSGRGR